jgi:hypothetical protein
MFTFHYVDVLLMLGFAFLVLWLRLIGVCVRELFAEAALTVTGHLRRPPNPGAEHALRAAFATLDRELAEILGDRTPRDRLS